MPRRDDRTVTLRLFSECALTLLTLACPVVSPFDPLVDTMLLTQEARLKMGWLDAYRGAAACADGGSERTEAHASGLPTR
jgi:hypothetical protein